MINIQIKTIPHKSQDYDTVGNWKWDENGDLLVFISEMENPLYEWLAAEHEINEAFRCLKDGIKEKDITKFDKDFEELRLKYPELIGDQEPGNMVSAPYNIQHESATRIEKVSATEHDVDWEDYDNTVNSLSRKEDVTIDINGTL